LRKITGKYHFLTPDIFFILSRIKMPLIRAWSIYSSKWSLGPPIHCANCLQHTTN